MQARTFLRYTLIAMIVRVLLLLFTIGFCLLPVLYPEPDITSGVVTQEVRSQRIAKDGLILEYRPLGEHANAIGELQNMLPAFQAEEGLLQRSHNPDIQLLLSSGITSDYLSITLATQAILAHPDKTVDPVQVDIILSHERTYLISMNQLVTLIQQKLDVGITELFGIEAVLLLLIACWTGFDRMVIIRKMKPGLLASERKEGGNL